MMAISLKLSPKEHFFTKIFRELQWKSFRKQLLIEEEAINTTQGKEFAEVLVARNEARREQEEQRKLEEVVENEGTVSKHPDEGNVNSMEYLDGFDLPLPEMYDGEDEGVKLRREAL